MDAGCLNNRRSVGARINRIREEQGLSLRKLAQMVNMDYAYICSIEGGKANPTLDSLTKLAEGLDVDIIEFFSGEISKDYAFLKTDE